MPFDRLRHFVSYLDTTNYHRMLTVLAVVLLAVGYAIGFSIATSDAKNKKNAADDRNLEIFTEWQMKVTSSMSKAGTTAATLAAFAQSIVTTPMNYSATAMERVEIINADAFVRLCQDLRRENPGVASLQLQSGGVISQFYPPGSTTAYLDILSFPIYQGAFQAMWRTGGAVIAGPTVLSGGMSGHGIFVRYPVFVGPNKSKESFWGLGNVLIRMSGEFGFLHLLNASDLSDHLGMDYAMWTYENNKLIVLDQNPTAHVEAVIARGMRMTLPVGKSCFFAIYPHGGDVPDTIESSTIAIIVIVVFFAVLLIVVALYLLLFLHFSYRHRMAPKANAASAAGTPTFVALLTLRGAQPVLDQSPIEGQRLFTNFARFVNDAAARNGCYVVTTIGDRCFYVVSDEMSNILRLSEDCVGTINMVTNADADNIREQRELARMLLNTSNNDNSKNGATTTAHRQSRTNTTSHRQNRKKSNGNSNIINVKPMINNSDDGDDEDLSLNSQSHTNGQLVACHCSAIVTVVQNIPCHYDQIADVYFYGTHRDLSKLGSQLDQLKNGELGFTDAFEVFAESVRQKHIIVQLSATHDTRRIKEKGRVAVIAISWWNADDSEDDETSKHQKQNDTSDDPSTAMIMLNDIYLKKMTAITQRQYDKNATLNAAAARVVKQIKQQQILSQQDPNTTSSSNMSTPSNAAQNAKENSSGNNNGNTTNDIVGKKKVRPASGDDSDGSGKSIEATYLTRSGTILAFRINGDPRNCFDIIKKIVEENRGQVISCFENTIIAAYNLMSAGGHHQLRAADTVVRVRVALDGIAAFVASIHHGKVNALVSSDGIVMATGEVIQTTRTLLNKANEMSKQMAITQFRKENAAAVGGSAAVPAVIEDSSAARASVDTVPTVIASAAATAKTDGDNQQQHQQQPQEDGDHHHDQVTVFMNDHEGDAMNSSSHTNTSTNGVVNKKNTGKEGTTTTTPPAAVNYPTDPIAIHHPISGPHHGLCLLYCHAEMSSMYDCEAVDIEVRVVATASNSEATAAMMMMMGNSSSFAGGPSSSISANVNTSLITYMYHPAAAAAVNASRPPDAMNASSATTTNTTTAAAAAAIGTGNPAVLLGGSFAHYHNNNNGHHSMASSINTSMVGGVGGVGNASATNHQNMMVPASITDAAFDAALLLNHLSNKNNSNNSPQLGYYNNSTTSADHLPTLNHPHSNAMGGVGGGAASENHNNNNNNNNNNNTRRASQQQHSTASTIPASLNIAPPKTSTRIIYRLGEPKMPVHYDKATGGVSKAHFNAVAVNKANMKEQQQATANLSGIPEGYSLVGFALVKNGTAGAAGGGGGVGSSLINSSALGGGGGDEWMYTLKDDQSAYVAVNSIFSRLTNGDVKEAVRLYQKLMDDVAVYDQLSELAKTNMAKLLGPIAGRTVHGGVGGSGM